MPKIQAWKCQFTNQVFGDRQKFIKHLKKLRQTQTNERRIKIASREFDALTKTMRVDCQTFGDIEEFITNNWEAFAYKSLAIDSWRHKETIPKLINITLSSMRMSPNVSNSHAAPFGKQTNWHRTPELPIGYLGWHGRVRIQFESGKKVSSFSASDVFSIAGLKTGSGGGGGDGAVSTLSYSVSLFADDWPGLVQAEINTKLSNNINYSDEVS